jgi:hypothetical protein
VRRAWNWILTRLFGPEEDTAYESKTGAPFLAREVRAKENRPPHGQCKCGKRPRHTYVDGDTI